MSSQTLHLETEIGRTTATAMTTNAGDIDTLTGQLQAQINDFVGTHWMGQAAVQFQTEFDTWIKKMTAETAELTALAEKLTQEIQNWEAAASALGG